MGEAQTGKKKEGMEMNIVIGALQNKTFPGMAPWLLKEKKMKTGTINSLIEGDVFTRVMNTSELDFLPMAKLFWALRKRLYF